MPGIILPRLRLGALAGAHHLEDIEEPHLARLVEGQLEEDVDLDFKAEPYGPKESDRRDLAADVAAMANTRGGAIVLGIAELVRGRAGALQPFRLDEIEVQRMRQIVASLVFPTPSLEVLPIKHPPDPVLGYYLLVIPRSPLAPHAVRMDNKSLRYPRRYGRETIYMSETEVADAYRDRFRGEDAQVARLDSVHAQGQEQLGATNVIWATLALAPNVPGSMDLRQATLRRYLQWVRGAGHICSSPFGSIRPIVSTGVRRITVTGGPDQETGGHRDAYAELHTDGSGFVATLLPQESRRSGLSPPVRGVVDETLVAVMVGMLALLNSHAVDQAAARGDAVAQASLTCWSIDRTTPGETAELLQVDRSGLTERVGGTRAIRQLPSSRHTISLDGISSGIVDRLIATRLLLTDLVQGFGLPEVLQVDASGALRRPYWNARVIDRPFEWLVANGAATVDTLIEV
jgi:Putative DNA-binding domain